MRLEAGLPSRVKGTGHYLYLRFLYSVSIIVLVAVHAAREYVGMLISLWLFLFPARPKEFFLDGLKKLEQRSYKCVEFRGEYVE
jgi:hypothetical protein